LALRAAQLLLGACLDAANVFMAKGDSGLQQFVRRNFFARA
jgi:hypothetical protein